MPGAAEPPRHGVEEARHDVKDLSVVRCYYVKWLETCTLSRAKDERFHMWPGCLFHFKVHKSAKFSAEQIYLPFFFCSKHA